MSQSLAKKEPTWDDYINEVMPQFNQIAERDKLVLWKSESQFAMQAIAKNTGLQKCSVQSVQNAVINVASVGLTLNPADGYAYLVPEYNKQTNQNECQLRISFKGLIKVATDSGGISWVKAEIVKEEDAFTFKGVSELPQHDMQPFSNRGDTVGVYCVAKTTDGDYLVDIINVEELAKIQSCAKTQKVWEKWPDEMAKKAVIKRASKQWPRTDKSSRLHKAVEVINEVEGFDPDYLIYSEEQKKHFDYLIENEKSYEYMIFSQEIDQDILMALFSSFEKGQKTKGKTKCRDLERTGFKMLDEMKMKADEFCLGNDAHGLAEVIEDLEPYGKRLWWDTTTEEIRTIATELMENIAQE